ncbi:MAG: hypothetical protein JSW25_06190, partial [Thermoplasmata archaeon]
AIKGDNPNLYITGTTTAGIEEVWVSQTVGGETTSARVPVAEDGTFSVVRTMLDGSNSFTVTVTDAYGNTHTTEEYSVEYEYKRTETDRPGPTPLSPSTYALWILVIAVALFITAVVVTRMLRRDED